MLREFAESYLSTPEGQGHIASYEASRAAGRASLEAIEAQSERGQDVTDAVLTKLLPHQDTPFNRDRHAWTHIAPAITRDLKKWFEKNGWVSAEQWPSVASAILAFFGDVKAHPDHVETACESFEAANLKGIQAAFLSPMLNALNPERFLIVNTKTLKTLRFLTGQRCSRALRKYPQTNQQLQELLKQLVSCL